MSLHKDTILTIDEYRTVSSRIVETTMFSNQIYHLLLG